MGVLKKLKTYTFLVSIAYFVIGIIMLVNPKFICDAVNYIVGTLVLIYGIIFIVNFLKKNQFNEYSKFNLLAGLLAIVFGLYILLNPTVLLSIIPFVAGMLILLDGFGKLKNALDLKKYNYKSWWIGLLLAVLFIGFGLFAILKSFAVTELIVRIIGAILLVDAISDIWSYFCYKKYVPQKNKVVIENEETKVIELKEK